MYVCIYIYIIKKKTRSKHLDGGIVFGFSPSPEALVFSKFNTTAQLLL